MWQQKLCWKFFLLKRTFLQWKEEKTIKNCVEKCCEWQFCMVKQILWWKLVVIKKCENKKNCDEQIKWYNKW